MMTRGDIWIRKPATVAGLKTVLLMTAVAVLLCASVHGQDALSGIRINVREASEITTDKILLGDIADIQAPAFLMQKLAAIDVGFSPRLGDLRILQGNSIRTRIESDSLVSGDTDLTIPEKVFVSRLSQELSTQQLRDLFEEHVSTLLVNQDFTIREFTVRGVSPYPWGHLALSVITGSDVDARGRLTLQVSVSVDNEPCGRVSLSGWIDVYEDVLCASRSMPRGTVLSPGDLQVARTNVSRVKGDFLSSMDQTEGMVLKTGVRKGASISQSMLDSPPLVRNGDRVTLRAGKENLIILASGIARGDGRQGDQIRVENLTSNRVVYGTVTGEAIVDVIY